jgi:hypothetical protein
LNNGCGENYTMRPVKTNLDRAHYRGGDGEQLCASEHTSGKCPRIEASEVTRKKANHALIFAKKSPSRIFGLRRRPFQDNAV